MDQPDLPSRHARLVRLAAKKLLDTGATDIRAALPGFERPVPVQPAAGPPEVPDLVARGERPLVVEVETEDSILDPFTAEKWRLFSVYAAEQVCQFCLVVPGGTELMVNQRLEELGIQADVWPIHVTEEDDGGD
jgi:hypothetical protein